MFFHMVYESGQIFLPFCHNPRVWQTDGRIYGQTDRWTDRILIARPRLHSMQRGKTWSKRLLKDDKEGAWRLYHSVQLVYSDQHALVRIYLPFNGMADCQRTEVWRLYKLRSHVPVSSSSSSSIQFKHAAESQVTAKAVNQYTGDCIWDVQN